jgi:hydrogenase large subunit
MRCRFADLQENGPGDKFKGIDIMRTVRSFDPCLPRRAHVSGKRQSVGETALPTLLNQVE